MPYCTYAGWTRRHAWMYPPQKLQTLQRLRILKISEPDMQHVRVGTQTLTHTQQRSSGGAEDTAGLLAWGSQQKVRRDKAAWLWLHVRENLHNTSVQLSAPHINTHNAQTRSHRPLYTAGFQKGGIFTTHSLRVWLTEFLVYYEIHEVCSMLDAMLQLQ